MSLFFFTGAYAQSEEELDELMEELDDDVATYTGEGEVFNKVDVEPKPLTSMTDFYSKVNTYIKKNYPEGVNSFGRIYVDFVVEKDGALTNFSISQGLDEKLNKVAIDAVKNYGNWNPGKKGVVIVRTLYSLPVMIKEDLIKQ